MEAEVGTPIEYNPEEFINKSSNNFDEPDEPDVDEQYYQPPPQQPVYYAPPPQQAVKNDIFENIDKTGYVIIFVAFLLGFFMGKTMQPVILRPG